MDETEDNFDKMSDIAEEAMSELNKAIDIIGKRERVLALSLGANFYFVLKMIFTFILGE